ncbi:MAG: hypothetical protein ACKVP7_14790 [Hyphomicrobiaceae bacterium]
MTADCSLLEAEYFLFFDARTDGLEGEHLQLQYHQNEDWEEYTRIHQGRAALLQSLALNAPARMNLYSLAQFPLPPELVHTESWLGSRLPAQLGHLEIVMAPPLENHWYTVVSPEWKAAIQNLEPATHEFFPHKLHFLDGTVADRFVLRTRIEIEGALVPRDSTLIHDYDPDRTKLSDHYWLNPLHGTAKVDVRVAATKLRGHHWIKAAPERRYLASRPLADRLRLLLPRTTFLIPMRNFQAQF